MPPPCKCADLGSAKRERWDYNKMIHTLKRETDSESGHVMCSALLHVKWNTSSLSYYFSISVFIFFFSPKVLLYICV